MSQAFSRKLATVVASRNNVKRRRKISNRTTIAITSLLSQKSGLLPCVCDHNLLRMMRHGQTSSLSQSSNALWHRNPKSKEILTSKKQQRNNSTTSETRSTSLTRSNNLKTFRKSIIQRFKRKKKMPTITARSVIRKHTNTNNIKHRNNTDDPPLPIQDTSQYSSYDSDRIISENHSYDSDENHTLEPTISSFQPEQQNINATNNTSRTAQGTSQSTMNDYNLSKKTKSMISSRTNRSAIINSSKRKKQKRTTKRKITLSKSKRKNLKASLSRPGSKTNSKRRTYGRSPFPNPNMFHSIPPMEDSDEITKDNIHANHLCCKPITSVKDLSVSDQQKLIEHDYLTLISLLPMYLGSQGNFQHKIREKTNISYDGATELDRLMNEWGSTRLFIGANSHYKTLTQRI